MPVQALWPIHRGHVAPASNQHQVVVVLEATQGGGRPLRHGPRHITECSQSVAQIKMGLVATHTQKLQITSSQIKPLDKRFAIVA